MSKLRLKINKLETNMLKADAYIKQQALLLEKNKTITYILLLAMVTSFAGGMMLAYNKNWFKKATPLLIKAIALQRMVHWIL